ncbi:hypothetical protein BRAS3843_720001 [Bradyrhizobium sp. STM 3843]|nr:hypothetical protein BRAS3843_720001 [Bradyrhizobium sp. STM 3843]
MCRHERRIGSACLPQEGVAWTPTPALRADPPRKGRAIAFGLFRLRGLMVRDARLCRALTMRVYDFTAEEALILRSPPQAGVSKDGREEGCPRPFQPYAIPLPARGRVKHGRLTGPHFMPLSPVINRLLTIHRAKIAGLEVSVAVGCGCWGRPFPWTPVR